MHKVFDFKKNQRKIKLFDGGESYWTSEEIELQTDVMTR